MKSTKIATLYDYVKDLDEDKIDQIINFVHELAPDKEPTVSVKMKEKIEARIQEMIDRRSFPGYHCRMCISDWKRNGKDRTYYKVVETRNNSKRYVEYDFGYYDNIEDIYVPGKRDAFGDYDLSGDEM